LGHVGFLAEVERSDLEKTAEQILSGAYDVEERLTVDVTVRRNGGGVAHQGWALNDATVEKAARERMLDLVVEVDGRPLSRWGGDGIVCATPTGSTAYAFSAGGPVVWPTVHALLVVPLSAHALFARPLVIAPESCVAIELLTGPAVLFCDGRRTVQLAAGDRVEVRRGEAPVRLARLRAAPFTDRLVEKFQLPVRGWRGPLHRD
jgi:NAD+ kinase